MILAIVLVAIVLASGTYVILERVGTRALVPMALRAIAWAGLGVLLFNIGCPSAGSPPPPIILVDGSLSMRADTAAFRRLLDSAASRGDVRFFGDARPASDQSPRGRSLIGPALRGVGVSGRPVEVWTDGEVEDGHVIGEDLFEGITVRRFPRPDTPWVALTGLRGRSRVSVDDSLVIQGDVRSLAPWPNDALTVELRLGDRVLAGRAVPEAPGQRSTFRLVVPAARLGPGVHLLDAVLVGPDVPARTTHRVHHVTVVATPGVVLVADPGDWDARFFYRALRDIADTPVQGFVRLAADEWRVMESLDRIPQAAVRRAARSADLVVLKGRAGNELLGPGTRAVVRWSSGEGNGATLEGDWFLSTAGASPLTSALIGMALDSFPPVVAITPLDQADDEWVGLSAQQGRRGAVRPIVLGGERNGRRYVTIGALGLWRWAFPGGSAEQGYRALVASMTSWLLAGEDSVAGVAAPVAHVVHNGRPVVFRWRGAGTPEPTAVTHDDGTSVVTDTLVFDGSGVARLWLPAGSYRFTVDGAAPGAMAVERYSEEWLPRLATLEDREGAPVASAGRSSAREALWLFGLVVLALAGEWMMRRRMGLR
jgi:hypothetical protein